ncbi:MAG: GNAT family N-acetyltransferase [Desulfoprunum sp.]|uniref:GNAT family N-acetyltransferase n=1 Tax=Desulfoprunum sp. TaxID=2020866 RepID=UPI003C72246E
MKKKKVLLTLSVFVILTLTFSVTIANIAVNNYSRFTYDTIDDIAPAYSVIVLGTSKKLRNGRENQYHNNRIKAASKLYLANKCKKIIVSGDNRKVGYNEPRDMKNDLVLSGVPEQDIICDYAGRRTLDSIIRYKEIFGQTAGIVVSQKFHNNRAVNIAFSPVAISDGTSDWYGLGPVSVLPGYQRRGIGTTLIRQGLARLHDLGARGCCLVGHPEYYRKFGFENVSEFVVEGVPPEVFFALSFNGLYPQGKVTFHAGFRAEGR